MSGLNFGYSSDNRNSKKTTDMNSQGVHYSKLSKKWVIRMPNNTNSAHVKPFISVGQFSTKQEAERKYNELLK